MFYITLSILIAIAIIAIGIAMIRVREKYKRPIDYYNLFMIGLIWLAIGIPFDNYILSGLGLVFVVSGLINHKKWKSNRLTWSMLTIEEKKIKVYLIAFLLCLIILGMINLLFLK